MIELVCFCMIETIYFYGREHGDGRMGNGSVGKWNMGNGSMWVVACQRKHVDESRRDESRRDESRGDGSRGDGSRGDGSHGDRNRGDGSCRDCIVFCWARQVIICFIVCFQTTYFFVGHGRRLCVS